MNGNAELLRKNFVSHEGKEELTVLTSGGRYSVDFGWVCRQMTLLMESKIVDPHLREWVAYLFHHHHHRHNDLRYGHDGLYEGLFRL